MHAFHFREAARSFAHHRGLAYTAMFSLTAALTLLGVLLLITHNARVALDLIGDRREMVIYLRDDVTPTQRDLLIGRLGDLYGAVTYVSKEQAWKDFAAQLGDPALLEGVQENPLPASIQVKLKAALLTPAAMDQAAHQISQFAEVEEVRYGEEWVRRLDRIGTALIRGTLAVGLLAALAIVLILYNTIRLTVLARRHQVEIMSRLGASDRFIASPFVIEAMFEAGVSALLALALIFGFQQAMSMRVAGLVFLPPLAAVAFVGAAIGFAWLASMLALTRVLRAVGP